MFKFLCSLIASILIIIFGMINLTIWGSAILAMILCVSLATSLAINVSTILEETEENYESN